jgi:hypothetical protein
MSDPERVRLKPCHSTTWEDAGMAGVLCSQRQDGKGEQVICSGDNPEPCHSCGALLSLKWSVEIVEEVQ